MGLTCLQGHGHHYATFVAAAQAAGLSLTGPQLQGLCAAESGVFVVAESDAEPVGWLLGQRLQTTLEIFDLVVLPAHRRRQVASRLVQFVAQKLPAGAHKMLVEVARDNQGAQSLYRALGFVQVGLRKKYYARSPGTPQQHQVDALLLQWDAP